MPATYENIATTTLGSAAATITFSSINSGYTDLRLVLTGTNATLDATLRMQFNSDTGTNYSITELYGDGTTATTTRSSNQTRIQCGFNTLSTTVPSLVIVDLFSYSGSTYKTCLITTSQDRNGSGNVYRTVGLYRSTSAINSILLFPTSGTFAIGTIATLYGILRA
jgi:hypothetical protein